MSEPAEPAMQSSTLEPLPILSPLSIERTRALWRHLAWQMLPETFVGVPGSESVPDAAQASLLAMVRGLHSTEVSPAAATERQRATEHLRELLALGPAPVLQRGEGESRPPSRLDLAGELLELDPLARLALELVAVTALDPVTAHTARVLAPRLRRHDATEVEFLDDALASGGLGAGVVGRLCGERGVLRQCGAVAVTPGRAVQPTPALLAFLDGVQAAESPLDEHAVRLRIPSEVLTILLEMQEPWLDVLSAALAAGRPVLLSGMAGFGAPALVALVAQRHEVGFRGLHAAPLVDVVRNQPSDLLVVLHAEARLSGDIWLLHHLERLEGHFREQPDSLRRLSEGLLRIRRPIVLAHEGPVAPEIAAQLALEAGLVHVEVPAQTPAQRERILLATLQAAGVPDAAAGQLAIAGRAYSLGVERAVAAVAYADQRAQLRAAQGVAKLPLVKREGPAETAVPTEGEMRMACAASTTSRLRQYGSRVDSAASWAELVLDKDTLDSVKNLARFAQVRDKLFDEWGFGKLLHTGRALSAMFSGPSGTGKTMVAGLIAKDLGVELYRVDLSRVMSKYIGETEERLGALFSEASQVGAALLFDEADSLFGQRTEIKSSNDRYANLEVNYLLQRLEEFDGVVILTTNLGSSIDEAFLRRLRFRVQFPFPSAKERAKLWDVLLPREMPQDDEGLDVDWMGEVFELSGGHVRNAVLRGAMYAAEAGTGLSMRMLYDAAAAEYRELGKLAPAYPFDD